MTVAERVATLSYYAKKYAMSPTKENRIAGRYPTFCVIELESGIGVTHNLSTTGVCFTTDEAFEVGSKLRCFILMKKKDGNTRRIRCEGQVVRTEKKANGWEIAINFSTLEW